VIHVGSKKTVGVVLLVVGIIVLLVSVLADVIGIGNQTVFGYLQIAAAVVGAIVAVVGLVLTLKG
jgi:hypothetical protein